MAKLKSIQEAIRETTSYIKARKEGTVKSLRTGFHKLDEKMIDGFEWQSTITIGGRPSVGKSAYSDCLLEGCLLNNLGDDGLPDFDILDFNWELSSKVMLLRRLSAKFKKTYKYIISADNNTISDGEMQEIEEFLKDYYSRLPITYCEEPQSVKEFVDTVKRFVDKRQRKTLVRVDHTLLAKRGASEESQVVMLLNLLMESNQVKKDYPVIFMFLTQINREFEERQENRTDKAFPRQGDVYGGDAAAMFSETILLLNKPSKYGITYYGKSPGGLNVMDNDLFAHIVKNRNAPGDHILNYKENFENMSIREV